MTLTNWARKQWDPGWQETLNDSDTAFVRAGCDATRAATRGTSLTGNVAPRDSLRYRELAVSCERSEAFNAADWQDDDVEAVFEISAEEDYPEEWLCDSLDADSMSVEEACWMTGYNAS